jgi:hypothetical protein
VVWTPLCGPPLFAKRALQLASEQANALGPGEVSPEHLLLAALEVDLDRLREAVTVELGRVQR